MTQEFAPGLWIQRIHPPLRLRDFGLIAFDMDSTLINIECIDEIADAAGKKAEVAAITEAAMRGEITNFKESLRRRVALLRGVPESALHAVLNERLRLNPGARELVGLSGRGPQGLARERRLHLFCRLGLPNLEHRLRAQQCAGGARGRAHR